MVTYDAESGNRTQATLVGGEYSHHCTTPAPRENPIPNSCNALWPMPAFSWTRCFVVFYDKLDSHRWCLFVDNSEFLSCWWRWAATGAPTTGTLQGNDEFCFAGFKLWFSSMVTESRVSIQILRNVGTRTRNNILSSLCLRLRRREFAWTLVNTHMLPSRVKTRDFHGLLLRHP